MARRDELNGIRHRDTTRDTRNQNKAREFVNLCYDMGFTQKAVAMELGMHRNSLFNKMNKKVLFKPGDFAMIALMRKRYKFLK